VDGIMDKVLPCPFCKSKKVECIGVDWRHAVRCAACNAEGPRIYGKSEAAMKWNMYGVNIISSKKEEEIKKKKQSA
jgi:hypothetical protein